MCLMYFIMDIFASFSIKCSKVTWEGKVHFSIQVKVHCEGRNLEEVTEADPMEERCLLASLSWPAQLLPIVQAQLPRDGTAHRSCTLLHWLVIKICLPDRPTS